MENIGLYLTIMFWIYMVGLGISTLALTFLKFPIKTVKPKWQVLLNIAEYIFLLYWITQLRGVVV